VKENKITIAIISVVFVLLIAYVFVFQVSPTEIAVQYRPPGKVLRVINRPGPDARDESGLYFRLPFPIDQVKKYDRRVRVIDGPLAQTQLKDEWQVIISIFATWRLADAVSFEETLGGNIEQAEKHLKDVIFSETSNAVSNLTFHNLVSTDAEELQFDSLEQNITNAVRDSIQAKGYGIELLDFGIRRVAIPKSTTQEVFSRMEAEREQVAESFRAEGRKRNKEIIAEAEKEAAQILADAESEAKRIKSEGEAAEAEFYDQFAEEPELAIFLRRLESLRTIAQKARESEAPISFVLDTQTEPLSALYRGPQGEGIQIPELSKDSLDESMENLENEEASDNATNEKENE
jgi:membrane protease subunit HflC